MVSDYKKGGLLIAVVPDNFGDKTTRGKAYELTYVYHGLNSTHFRVINDEGEEIYPQNTRFRLVREEEIRGIS